MGGKFWEPRRSDGFESSGIEHIYIVTSEAIYSFDTAQIRFLKLGSRFPLMLVTQWCLLCLVGVESGEIWKSV